MENWLHGSSRIHCVVYKNPGQVTSGANLLHKRATITAVEADQSVLNEMVTASKNRRDLVVGLVKEIPHSK